MKSLFTLLFLTALLVNLLAQNSATAINLITHKRAFKSIATEENEIFKSPLDPTRLKMPIEFYFGSYGPIDSLHFGIHALEASFKENSVRSWFAPFAYAKEQEQPEFWSTRYFSQLDSNKVSYELVMSSAVTNDKTRMQVTFNAEEQNIEFSYLNMPDNFLTPNDSNSFFIGIMNNDSNELLTVDFLGGNCEEPSLEKSLNSLNFVNNLPRDSTVYTFSSIISTVNEFAIKEGLKFERTESGLRVKFKQNQVSFSATGITGKTIVLESEKIGAYHFIYTKHEGPMIIHVYAEQSQFRSSHKVFR